MPVPVASVSVASAQPSPLRALHSLHDQLRGRPFISSHAEITARVTHSARRGTARLGSRLRPTKRGARCAVNADLLRGILAAALLATD